MSILTQLLGGQINAVQAAGKVLPYIRNVIGKPYASATDNTSTMAPVDGSPGQIETVKAAIEAAVDAYLQAKLGDGLAKQLVEHVTDAALNALAGVIAGAIQGAAAAKHDPG